MTLYICNLCEGMTGNHNEIKKHMEHYHNKGARWFDDITVQEEKVNRR